MKIQTIHSNVLGDVVNLTSATGVRITDDNGNELEVRTESGCIVLHFGVLSLTLDQVEWLVRGCH